MSAMNIDFLSRVMNINEREAVQIPDAVIRDLEKVKALGNINMYSKNQILLACVNLGYYSTAIWISENFYLYLRGIEKGFHSSD